MPEQTSLFAPVGDTSQETPVRFDPTEGERRKREGMQKAAAAKRRRLNLELAREIAVTLCHKYGTTNADDVGRVMLERYQVESLGPATGSIFSDQRFEFTGTWVKSARASNHSRAIRVWRLKS